MHSVITVERIRSPTGAYLTSNDVAAIFASIDGVSAVCVRNQFLDRTTVSYEASDPSRRLDRIDQVLKSVGMRRVR